MKSKLLEEIKADRKALDTPWGMFSKRIDHTSDNKRTKRELAKTALEGLYISLI